ncbi:hypothetical protein [uncultured Haemophilus sp.]|nr:hypothetical protein [uncultured Haemophilus sp.]
MKLNKLTIMLGAAVMANVALADQTCEAPYRSALPAYTYARSQRTSRHYH